MAFDSPLHTIPTQRRSFANTTDLEMASMEEGNQRSSPGPSSPHPVLGMNSRDMGDLFASLESPDDSYSPASTDDIPPLTDLLTLSTYLLPLLQQAHRSALVTIFREFLAEHYFHPVTGPIVSVARAQLKHSQLQQEIDLQVLSEGRGWNVAGATDAELNKSLRKGWSKHLSTAETSGSFKKTVAEEMKNSLGKIVTGKNSFGGLESGIPMNSLLQSFNLTCMPFNLPIPRVFIRHLPTGSSHQPSNSSSSSSTTIAESHLVPVSASPPSFTPPPINEIELEQNVALPPSFHTHAANLFPILNDKVTVRSVVHGSNLSIRSPMAHPAVFEFLANATKCVATRGAVMARVLLKEVLDESWAKSSSWGEKEGWEWVNDLGGPGVLAGVEENHNWRSAIANMSSGGGVFRDDKQRERVVMWNQCWEAVRTARNEAMIAEDQGDAHALKGNNMAAISAFTEALTHDPSGRPRLLLKRATSYRASELYAQAEQGAPSSESTRLSVFPDLTLVRCCLPLSDLNEVVSLPESPSIPTVAPARAMLKKVRQKIRNVDKPGPNANTIKKAKKKANQKARAAGIVEDTTSLMDSVETSPPATSVLSPKSAAAMGLGLGVEIKQADVVEAAKVAVVDPPSQDMDVDVVEEGKPSAVEESSSSSSTIASPPRTSSTTPKPHHPPPSLPTPPASSTSPSESNKTLLLNSPSSTIIPAVSSPVAAEEPTFSSSSSSTSDAFVSSSTTSVSAETAATSAFDSPLTPRSEVRDVSLDRGLEIKIEQGSKPVVVVAEKKLPERRTSLVAIENVKLEIDLDDEEPEQEPEEEEMVFGRVERIVVEQPEVVEVSPKQEEAVVSTKSQSYSWDGTYAPVKEPREMEFEAGVWLMVCGEYFETQQCHDEDCFFLHELPDHSSIPPPPPPQVPSPPKTTPAPPLSPPASSSPPPAPSPPSEPINSLVRSYESSSSIKKATLEELNQDFLSPNPQEPASLSPSAISSPSPDLSSVRQFLPTLVFSSHPDDDEVLPSPDGTPVSAEDESPKKWFEQEGAWGNEAAWDEERRVAGELKEKEEEAQAQVVVEKAQEQQQQQPSRKKSKPPAPVVEKRLVPGAAPPSPPPQPKEKEVVVPASAAQTPASDRWWEKGSNAVRVEKKEEWVTAPSKKKAKIAGGAKNGY
ncbi:hypothetical protein BDY24DRAFT_374394 [Mrakia frigida]|uniref:tetratricopeptide repeat protein n=1 Tax=Mrakia frigida TaxID=29902 RepID=UPI003FCC1558